MKNNPLSPTPPMPKGKLHRTGEPHALKLRELFGHLDSGFDDIHRGVFIADKPIVSYAYAIARRGVGENDYGLPDVVDPPVLIGLKIDPSEEFIDTDAMTTAHDILKAAQTLRLENMDEDLEPEDLEDFLRDYSRSEFFDMSETSLGALGGEVGNRPDSSEFYLKVQEMIKLLRAEDILPAEELTELPDEILEEALKSAAKIIPQSRLLREVTSKEVVQIFVVPPFSTGDEAEFPERELPFDQLTSDEVDVANSWLMSQSTEIYQRSKTKANRWHGTSLSIARKAFPKLITPQVFAEGVRAGSAYDLDELEQEQELQREAEEYEDDD